MSVDNSYGEWLFESIGPGMVTMKVKLAERSSSVATFLKQRKLIDKWQFKPEIKKFFEELGYVNTLDIVVLLKTSGLVMPSAKAIEFRLRYL